MNFANAACQRFHVQAVTVRPLAPESLTWSERGRLSDRAKEERLKAECRYVDALVVPTPGQAQLGTDVDELIATVAGGPPGAQPALLVTGPAGTGKSTAVREAAWRLHQREVGLQGRRHPKRQPLIKGDGYTAWNIPVVWIDLTAAVQGKGVMGPLLNFCGHPDSGTGYALAGRCVDVAERHRWRLVVLDDVHNLALRRADAESIYNTVKQLNTALGQLGVAFVYLSTPEASMSGQDRRPTLLDNEQLAARLHEVEFLPFEVNFRNTESDGVRAWVAYLKQWELALLPVLTRERDGFLRRTHAKRLYHRSGGHIGDLAVMLKQASRRALASGQLRLSTDDLEGFTLSRLAVDYRASHNLVGRP